MPATPSSKHVFMSYSRRDQVLMERVLKFLRKQGIKVWLDNEKLIPGTPIWEKEIEKAIKTAAVVVVICSPDSNESEWVRREITFAERYRKRIFPLLAKGNEDTSISIRLSTRQYVDLRQNEETGLKSVSAAIALHLEELGRREREAEEEKKRVEKREQEERARVAVEGKAQKEREDQKRREAAEKARKTIEIGQESPSPLGRGARGEGKPTWLPYAIGGIVILALLFGIIYLARNLFGSGEPTPMEKVEIVPTYTATPQSLPQTCDGTEDYGPIKIGSTVVLGQHEKVNGDDNWESAMDEFVGKQAVVTEFFGLDRANCPAVRVDVDGGTWVWRIRSMELVDVPLVSVPTKTPTTPPELSATATPTLGVGSTMTSEKDGMVMVYVPAGEFKMGSEEGNSDERPVHTVYLDAFWIDQTEVTNSIYARCVESGACNLPYSTKSNTRDSYYGNPEFDDSPVIYVSWYDAKAYCEWADRRLPTEAEWEKAASWDEESQKKNIYPWGDSIDCSRANYWGKDGGCVGDTTDVGSYESGQSPYGAYDMAGNVWEWVADWYDENYYDNSSSSNPLGPDSGQSRVLRGGSWSDLDDAVRSANRLRVNPAVTDNFGGFRCSRSP